LPMSQHERHHRTNSRSNNRASLRSGVRGQPTRRERHSSPTQPAERPVSADATNAGPPVARGRLFLRSPTPTVRDQTSHSRHSGHPEHNHSSLPRLDPGVQDSGRMGKNGELWDTNGEVWYPRKYFFKYAVNVTTASGTLEPATHMRAAINSEGEPTLYGFNPGGGTPSRQPLQALPKSGREGPRERQHQWLERNFELKHLIDSTILKIEDIGVEADVYRYRTMDRSKTILEE